MAGSVEETRDAWNDGEDYRPEMPSATGGLCVGQRLLRRWTTPKGFFRRWPNDGHDVRQYIGDKQPPWKIKQALENEAVRDEQIRSCVVTPTLLDDGSFIQLDGIFSLKTGTSFKFTMSITQAAGTLVALEKAA